MEGRRVLAGAGGVTACVRPATAEDLVAIVLLCAEHAALENGACSAEPATLAPFLFAEHPRAWCFVAEDEGCVIGYATFSLEFSTWHAAEYAHLDCLYLKEGYRNAGLGGVLARTVAAAAAQLGCEFVEWQTPSWNTAAMRFYDRLRAIGSPKMRYRWTSRHGRQR
jgi:GNAT superfamily N-acetyltransferase